MGTGSVESLVLKWLRRLPTVPGPFFGLCNLAGIKPKTNVETGEDGAWLLKDLRKTCATYYDAHVPESSI